MARLRSFVSVLAAGVAFAAPVTVTSAAPVNGISTSHSPVAPSYRNPLRLALPRGQHAASCADPSVLHGQAAGDRHWYLYCTSDALTADERDSSGNPVIHNVPTFRSTDLIHWSYAGDALPSKPAWVADNGGLWAPDLVYHGGRT